MANSFSVTFWGVRGSVPCPGAEYAVYGGNTSCVSVQCGEQLLILDAGTGLRLLGQHIQEKGIRKFSLLLSHTHFDHISGLPFFSPAYDPACTIDLYAGHLQQPLEQVLYTVMDAPFFPISPATFRATMRFHDFSPGSCLNLGGGAVAVTTLLNHPDRAIGYRIEYEGKSICYVTDTEHTGTPDANILALIANADLVIYDSTFTDADFSRHQGWGHSSVEEGIRLCRQAGAKRLALFHHNPDYNDTRLAAIEQEAIATWSGAFAAREGMTVSILQEAANSGEC